MEYTPETKSRKRKQRAVLSCDDCRRRKLKCDRELPCNRCIHGGVAEKCAYRKDAHLIEGDTTHDHSTKRVRKSLAPPIQLHAISTTQPDEHNTEQDTHLENLSPVHPGKDRVAELEQRLFSLEALLSSLQNKPSFTPESSVHLENKDAGDIPGASTIFFKGRDYRTFYYGPTNPMIVITHFPDLRPFMKRVFIGSTLQRLRQDSKLQEDRARMTKNPNRILSVPSLRSLLPDKETVEKVIRTYFATFETTYRILHIPSFFSAYQTYWAASTPPNSDMDAIVLAIMACTLCTSTHESTRYDTDGSTFRSKAITWIKACEAWLRRQSNKHRTLATLQVRCLRLLAISTTCHKTKEYYQEVQQHMALMRSFGMHRDPGILGARCSVFEGEMRRRLWATSMELELQASIDKGTPSVLSSLEYDCTPPRNIMDFELHAGMKHLPESQPNSLFSDTSYLHCASQSVSLRIRLCATANSLRTAATFQEVLRDEQDVQSALAKIPRWKEPHTLLVWTLLDLQLRQFVVILHTQRAMNNLLRARPDHRYSLLTVLEATTTLIDRHLEILDMNNFALCCIRSDYLRAALLICHVAYHACLASDNLIIRIIRAIFERTMDKAYRVLEQRALRPGRGNHQYFYVSAAHSLAGTLFEPERAQALEKQATDRVCKLYYKILSLQDEPLEDMAQEIILGDGSLSAPALFQKTPETIDTVSFQLGNTLVDQPPLLPLDGFGDNAASGWMLDDFWFMDDLLAPDSNEKFDTHFVRDVSANAG
ncbi:hypothetical protein K458DRAFT_445398 [Lentithecium fluviatile CBS 122367]|uniref:Zn(2)-C6 fungal-type domain-containing protein n=1 Tax=Lentithecium fluviatile CBS 122367 TaxID=1168545 RepID=A0A6G1IQB8_9PLEO|nr:hypothetical protein K458DRAFT_445398 [Lentithecium fluviatile CBS 122367]